MSPSRAHVDCRVCEGESGVRGFLQWMCDHFARVENVVMVPVGARSVSKVQKVNGPGRAVILYSVVAVGFDPIEVEDTAAPEPEPTPAEGGA